MRIKFYNDTKNIKDADITQGTKEYMLSMLREDLKGEHDAINLYNAHIAEFQKIKLELEKKIKQEDRNIDWNADLETVNDAIAQEEHIRDEEMEHVEELKKQIESVEMIKGI